MPFWNRGLGLDPAATSEFTHTPGQVAFSPGGSQLLVTTKANTNAVDVFAIDHFGGPSKSPVVNAKDGAVPFAAAFDRAGTVDAAVSGDGHRLYVQTGARGIVDAYKINTNGSLTATGSVTVANTVGGESVDIKTPGHLPGGFAWTHSPRVITPTDLVRAGL